MKLMFPSLMWLCAMVPLLAGMAWAQNAAEGRKLYGSYCVTCHGEKGKGDGPAARALPIKAADHTNSVVMNQLTDKYLMDIIAKGGAAVGKSPVMPAWGGQLDENQIRDIVVYIRSMAASLRAGTK